MKLHISLSFPPTRRCAATSPSRGEDKATGYSRQGGGRGQSREGYVIFAVLIVIVVLSLVAYRFTDSMSAESQAGARTNDAAQARFAAISGLHYAAAVLSDRTTFFEDLGGNPYDNPDIFEYFEVPVTGSLSTNRMAYFSIRSASLNEDGVSVQRFGVIDEGGKLNINSYIAFDPDGSRLHGALMKLPLMTEEIADAIVDWVDADDEPRPAGAESSYYLSLPNPYAAKNGPLNSLDELLLVSGVTPSLLYGGDLNRNGIQDEGETDNSRGWSDFLTVYGREINVDMYGSPRVYLNAPLNDDAFLEIIDTQLIPVLGEDMVNFLILCRLYRDKVTPLDSNGNPTRDKDKDRKVVFADPGQVADAVDRAMQVGPTGQRLRSIMDLVNVRVTLPRSGGIPNDTDLVANSPLNDPVVLAELLPILLDIGTIRQSIEMTPRININTAPSEVLLAIPGMTDIEAGAIAAERINQDPTSPATITSAWLVTSGIMTPSRFRRLERYITGSTMVYRVQSIGFLDTGGPVARMEAVIDINQGAPRFLHIRDLTDLENPRGFQPPALSP